MALVATVMVGSTISRYLGSSPGTLPPPSITSASTSHGASMIVSGTPTRLLLLARVACTRNRVRSTAATISFTVVFPLLPVTHTTGPFSSLRRARAMSPYARRVSSTSSNSRPATGAVPRRTTAAVAPWSRAAGEIVVSVEPFAHQRDKECARFDAPGIGGDGSPRSAHRSERRGQVPAAGAPGSTDSCGPQRREHDLSLIERLLLGADDLVGLVALPGEEQGVARPCLAERRRDGQAPVDDPEAGRPSPCPVPRRR